MNTLVKKYSTRRMLRCLAICMLLIGAGSAVAAGIVKPEVVESLSPVTLRARYADLRGQLSHNQFNRPLYLDSTESSSHLTGDIYVLVDYPFSTVNIALNDPSHWCDVLTLHLNIKYCHASADKSGDALLVSVGTKYDKPLSQAFDVTFSYSVAAKTPDYFAVRLHAKNGPLSTSDYHIQLDAASLQEGKTFLHLTYSYAYSFAGRLAMQSYLATIGRDKVGFTIQNGTSKQLHASPDYIGGVRGLVERNTMRYYLAIDSYLSAFSAPPAAQREMRLQSWFTSTEQYAKQLHEMDRATYLEIKHSEYQRQQKPSS
ncbi:hypothetical protein ACXX82_01695 [Glaciimonas sp. GNP009]